MGAKKPLDEDESKKKREERTVAKAIKVEIFRWRRIIIAIWLAVEAGLEVHFDVFPAPREVEAGGSVVIKLIIRHAIC